jgi:nitroimidazol reductase NimA-like FMN-containing flavoprotein (pyridoxamine 5'-phosphate oxidase superfamily)
MQNYNQVRRRDRAVYDETWIKDFLRRAPYCALATVHERQPFIHTNLFVYDEEANCIYFHTATTGRTRSNIESNGQVCLSVSEMGRLLPADTALEFSVEYSGVAVFGTVKIVTEEAEARRGLQLLLDKYFPHLRPAQDYRPVTGEELARTAVFRLEIESWSGKQKKVGPDFPGAFFYNSQSGESTESKEK